MLAVDGGNEFLGQVVEISLELGDDGIPHLDQAGKLAAVQGTGDMLHQAAGAIPGDVHRIGGRDGVIQGKGGHARHQGQAVGEDDVDGAVAGGVIADAHQFFYFGDLCLPLVP